MDWAEIRQLQAELQRIQTSTTANRLSERNCIEVVNKLVEMKLLEVIYTLDGKEYVVAQHLEEEIRDALDAERGRVNTVDLQQILNVDLTHIEKGVASLLKQDSSLELVQGALISSRYRDNFYQWVNDILADTGNVSLTELSKRYGLPLDIITKWVESGLDGHINGQLDIGLLYSQTFITRQRARIRGLLSAVTRPMPVAPIISRGSFHQKLFLSILHELVSSSQLAGALHGVADKAVYIPDIYTRTQNRWVDNFLDSNGYLEYSVLSRVGIDDPRKYVHQRYNERDELVTLESCCLGPTILCEVEGALEEMKTTGGWVDVLSLLPTPCTEEDATLLLQQLCAKDSQVMIFFTVAASHKFLSSCMEVFQPLLLERAKKLTADSATFLRRMSQEDSGRGAGSGEGKYSNKQERKGKGKRDRRSGREEEAEESQRVIPFMTQSQISEVLLEKFDGFPEQCVDSLISALYKPLQDSFQRQAKELLETQAEGEAGVRRKRHASLQEQLQGLWVRARLFEKGAELFDGHTKSQLIKFLLHSLCTDMTNHLLGYLAVDAGVKMDVGKEMTNKERNKVIGCFQDRIKGMATSLNSSLSGKELEVFFQRFEALCEDDCCGVLLKKLDKKKEKQLLFSHLLSLQESLREERDPAMSLHLAVTILFQQQTGAMLHAPGRLVPHIITFLGNQLEPSKHSKLVHYQELVVLQLKLSSQQMQGRGEELVSNGNDSKEEKEDGDVEAGEAATNLAQVQTELEATLGDIKELVLVRSGCGVVVGGCSYLCFGPEIYSSRRAWKRTSSEGNLKSVARSASLVTGTTSNGPVARMSSALFLLGKKSLSPTKYPSSEYLTHFL